MAANENFVNGRTLFTSGFYSIIDFNLTLELRTCTTAQAEEEAIRNGWKISATIFFFGTLMLNFTHSYAQSDSAAEANKILKMEQQLLDTIPSGDTSLWNKYLDDNYFIITEDGTGYNKKDFLSGFGPMPKGYSGYIKLINPHFIFKDKVAILHYVSDEHEFVFGQELHTTYATTNTYIKTDTSWKVVASQVFEIPQLPPAIKVSVSILKNYTGIYQLTDSLTCTISVGNDTLFIQKKGRSKEALFAETETVFFRQSDTRGRKIFARDEKGNMLMRERRNGEDVVWKRIKSF